MPPGEWSPVAAFLFHFSNLDRNTGMRERFEGREGKYKMECGREVRKVEWEIKKRK